jgi:hypothetical protein
MVTPIASGLGNWIHLLLRDGRARNVVDSLRSRSLGSIGPVDKIWRGLVVHAVATRPPSRNFRQ